MKIFIYSPQLEISQIISDHLTAQGYNCSVQNTQESLSEEILNLKTLPDLLIMDYLSFNHDIFNIYDYLTEHHMVLPVIFFNDPCLTRSTRTNHWIAQLDTLVCKTNIRDFSAYRPAFEALEELIESDEMQPYIPLMQKAKPLPQSYIKEQYTLQYLREQSTDYMNSFCERNKLAKSLAYLLKILQENQNLFLTYSEIQKNYKSDGKEISEKSLSVIMSRLRKIIREDKEAGFLIYQEKNKFKFVRYRV